MYNFSENFLNQMKKKLIYLWRVKDRFQARKKYLNCPEIKALIIRLIQNVKKIQDFKIKVDYNGGII